VGNPRSSSRPVRGVDDIAPQTIERYHLIDDSFPGLDENGKLIFDQNNGTQVPLDQIPDAAIRDASFTFLADGAAVEWKAQPSALTEFLGAMRHRLKFDLSKFSQARLLVNVTAAGYTNAKTRVQYSTTGLTWYYLDGLASPSVGINTTGLKVSTWVDLCDGAKADVYLRLVGINGDGIVNPAFGLIAVQVK